MSKYSWILFMSLALTSCDASSTSTVSTAKISISRNFEGITLGMSEKDFKSQFSCRPFKVIPEDFLNTYIVYIDESNLKDYMCTNFLVDKPQILENIYLIESSFFEGKLYVIRITYSNYYNPGWDNFIFNTAQKYGQGKKSFNNIQWDDKVTTLLIAKEEGEQFQNYGEHFVVTYIDDLLYSKKDKANKEKSPQF